MFLFSAILCPSLLPLVFLIIICRLYALVCACLLFVLLVLLFFGLLECRELLGLWRIFRMLLMLLLVLGSLFCLILRLLISFSQILSLRFVLLFFYFCFLFLRFCLCWECIRNFACLLLFARKLLNRLVLFVQLILCFYLFLLNVWKYYIWVLKIRMKDIHLLG